MNDRQIKSFISIVESGSFSKAEEISYLSRQALKKHIDTLERELGFDLFVRSSKGVTLTPAGRQFYDGAKCIYSDLTSLVDSCRSLASRHCSIKIGNPSHHRLILERAFFEFSQRYPAIKQEVIFPDEANVVDAVLNGTVDVAECVLPHDIDRQKIGYIKLADMTYSCLLSETHPLAQKKELFLDDLSNHMVGLRQRGNEDLIQKLKEECQGITLVETAGNEMHSAFTFCYNHGIFISKAYYATALPPLISLPLKGTGLRAECCIIFKKDHLPIVDKFIGIVREHYPIEIP